MADTTTAQPARIGHGRLCVECGHHESLHGCWICWASESCADHSFVSENDVRVEAAYQARRAAQKGAAA